MGRQRKLKAHAAQNRYYSQPLMKLQHITRTIETHTCRAAIPCQCKCRIYVAFVTPPPHHPYTLAVGC